MNKQSAISLMNTYGSQNVPFLFIVDYKMEHIHVIRLDELPDHILYSISDDNTPEKSEKAGLIDIVSSPRSSDYEYAFNKVKHHISQGNSFLTNLTFQSEIALKSDLRSVFHIAHAKYKLLVDNEFLVFSPECFIKITNGTISTFPMKGTIDANEADAEHKVLNNYKETAEHATIVDLLRNDLSMIAHNVRVEKYRYIDRIKTNKNDLLQVSSKITGQLDADYNTRIGTILFTMLPAGSVSGAPKPKTLEIIDEVENYARGYYTGVFGVFDGANLDSAVMIRFIEKQGDAFVYKSGGGITALSDMQTEFNELKSKIYVPIG